ncbi:MAG: hypothetical protein AAGI71_10150 [Bacteroidota bacterium]
MQETTHNAAQTARKPYTTPQIVALNTVIELTRQGDPFNRNPTPGIPWGS